MRPEGPREPSPGSGAVSNKSSRGSSGCGVDRPPVTQGIGLWPKPWAPISRPVGPVAVPRLFRGSNIPGPRKEHLRQVSRHLSGARWPT